MEEFHIYLKPDAFASLIIGNNTIYVPNSTALHAQRLSISNAQFLYKQLLPNDEGIRYTFYCDIKNNKVTKRYKVVLVTKYHQYYEGTAVNCDEEDATLANIRD